jgi:hypothetical protein
MLGLFHSNQSQHYGWCQSVCPIKPLLGHQSTVFWSLGQLLQFLLSVHVPVHLFLSLRK